METGGLALTAIPTEFRLDGKTAVITGGGSGIGRAVALKFAAAGADVRILEINEKSASAVADEIAASGGSASFHSCDVTDQAAVSELLSHIARRGRIRGYKPSNSPSEESPSMHGSHGTGIMTRRFCLTLDFKDDPALIAEYRKYHVRDGSTGLSVLHRPAVLRAK